MYLCKAWAIGRNQPARWLKQQQSTPKVKVSKPRGIIEGDFFVSREYDPRTLYVQHRIREIKDDHGEVAFEGSLKLEKAEEWRAEAKVEWALDMSESDKEPWLAKSRMLTEMRPMYKDMILESLRANPSKSFRQISEELGGAVSHAAIHRWLSSYPSYCTYVHRALPLLTTSQRAKHVAFARRFLANWGLPLQRILLLMPTKSGSSEWCCDH